MSERTYMVKESELKKYGVFDKIEKKELSFYLLLDDAIEFIEAHMEPDLTSRGKELVSEKLHKLSEYICTGETEENWYKMVMNEMGLRYVEEPKKRFNPKRIKVSIQEQTLFHAGVLKMHGDEYPDTKSLREMEEEAALSRTFVKGWALSGDFEKIGKF